jgi:RimJ/RimL family protein N-acetyltransferase
LEAGKQDRYAWVGLDGLELLMEGRTDGDRRLRDVVAKAARIRLTDRLRLEPIGPEHAADLWRLHQDEAIAAWCAGPRSEPEARSRAGQLGADWERHGVSKWIAYERGTGTLVGRGGLSRIDRPGPDQVEIGWAVLGPYQGQGYAAEIGRAGLDFAFTELRAAEVRARTEAQNRRSRAVMERIGMRYDREIRRAGPGEGAPFVQYTVDHP